MKVTHEDATRDYANYYETDKSFKRYSLVLADGVNELDPLVLLKLINGDDTMEDRVAVVSKMINGKSVQVMDGDLSVKSFVHNGDASISMLFTAEPYLLQVVIDYCYSLILKKLTPPSPVSSGEVSGEKK